MTTANEPQWGLYVPQLESLATLIEGIEALEDFDVAEPPLLVVEGGNKGDGVELVEDTPEARADGFYGWVRINPDVDIIEFTQSLEERPHLIGGLQGDRLRLVARIIVDLDELTVRADSGPVGLHPRLPVADYEFNIELGELVDDIGALHAFYHRPFKQCDPMDGR